MNANAILVDMDEGMPAGFADYLSKLIDMEKPLSAPDSHLAVRAA